MTTSDEINEDALFAGRVFKGPNKTAMAIEFLTARSIRNVLLVHGSNSYLKSGAADFFASLTQQFNCVEFSNYTPNPTIEEGMAGAKCFFENDCEAIIAVGGGSTVDIAKLINVFQAHDGQEYDLARGIVKPHKPLVPLIAAPTTSGSGSEATHFAVVYIGKEKFSLADHQMLPDKIILEGEFTKGLQGREFWTPVFDAVCQAIESFWSAGANDQSKSYARAALRLAWPILTRSCVLTPEERTKLMMASHLAGCAINITKTTAPHALSYTLTTNFNIPHGNAVALFLGSFFKLNVRLAMESRDNPVGSSDLHERVEELLDLMGGVTLDDFDREWKLLMRKHHLIESLSDAGVKTRMAVNDIIDGVNLERLGNHPITLTRDDLRQHIYQICDMDF